MNDAPTVKVTLGKKKVEKLPCARACLATQLTTALAHCEKCIQGTIHDHAAFTCMAKLAYLRSQYDTACDYYIRAAAIHILRNASAEELQRLRRLMRVSPARARELAATIITEHEPTLIYHLGHAWHCISSGTREHRLHLERYTRGIRGLAPEADDLSSSLLLHFHDQGLAALSHKSSLLFTVFEQYNRMVTPHINTAAPQSVVP